MADQRLDQVMLDVKQTSTITSQAESNLKEQVKDAEALRDVLSGVDAEQRKILASQLDIGESMSESKKTIEAMKESLNKIPSVSKAIDVIQKKTGKSYKESLDVLQKSLEATKRHTKANKALLDAVNSISKSYKATADQIERGSKSVKTLSKSQKDLNMELKKSQQFWAQISKLASALTGQFSAVFGGAGASGQAGALRGIAGSLGAFGKFGTGMLGDYAQRRREREVSAGEDPSKMTRTLTGVAKGFAFVGPIAGAFADAFIDSMLYEAKKNIQQRIFSEKAGALGANEPGRQVSLSASGSLSREEMSRYGETAFSLGIIRKTVAETEEDIKGLAVSMKLYGDEIAVSLASNIIQSTNSIEGIGKKVNSTFEQFRDIAKETGVPLRNISKWIGESAALARFLGVDMGTVQKITMNVLKNEQQLFKLGITKQNIGKVVQDITTGRMQHGMAESAFWAQKIGLKGSVTQQIEQYMLGGQYFKEKPGGGYNLEQGPMTGDQITQKTIEQFQKTILSGPSGFLKGMSMMQAGIAPIKTQEALRFLMTKKPGELTEEVLKEIEDKNASSEDSLARLVSFETITQKWQDTVASLLLVIATKDLSFKQVQGKFKDLRGKLSQFTDLAIPKRHTGGLIPRGTVSEVLTNESMQHLGKDSFFAFNPTHDIKIGSPQTTKESLRRSLPSAGLGSEQKIEVNLNVAGSVITDNELLSKIESLFANRRGLV